jgi:AcrR family transcriptional regulator
VERRRREIVEAAYEVFAEKGYRGAGIADIAGRLKIGHGTFYRYFNSKRDILDHVVDYAVERFLAIIAVEGLREVTSAEQLRTALRTIGRDLFDEISRDPRLPTIVLLEMTSVDEELLHRALGLLETLTATLTPLLDTGIRNGLVRGDVDAASLARAVVGCLMSGLAASTRQPMNDDERERYVETVVTLLSPPTA